MMTLLKGDNKDNILTGGNQADTLVGYGGDDVLVGGAGDDILKGGAGNDVLVGGAGNDFLYGDSGADVMVGGAGDDVYKVDNGGDVVTELAGGGTDTVRASISWTLAANVENLTLTGSGAINGVGNDLNNTLKGNSANNVLDGGAGDDFLNGGLGVDTLLGGAGNDAFKIDDFNGDTINGGAGNDSLQINADNQTLDLRYASTISSIEAIRLGDSHTTLITDAANIIALSDTHTLKVDASDGSNTVQLDGGWTDQGTLNGYHTFTKDGATLALNAVITDIVEPQTFTISDAASAAAIGSVFDSGEQDILIDFGGKSYSDWGLSTIDLSGFGLEDKLILAIHDGIGPATVYSAGPSNRSSYILKTYNFGGGSQGFYTRQFGKDHVAWGKGATKATLFSQKSGAYTYYTHAIRTTPSGGQYSSYTLKYVTTQHHGSVQLVGLPQGLADSHFLPSAFV